MNRIERKFINCLNDEVLDRHKTGKNTIKTRKDIFLFMSIEVSEKERP